MHREEKLLIAVVMFASAAMFVGSFQYIQEAQYFPQVVALVTMFFGATIIANRRFNLAGEATTDLVGTVQDRAELEEQVHGDDDGSRPELNTAEPGSFRINLPLLYYTVPFTSYRVTHRATLAVLLVVYLGLVWLVGVFVSSVVFVLLYGKVVGLRRGVFVGIVAFTVAALLVFGVWLETPLFRPSHDLFGLAVISV